MASATNLVRLDTFKSALEHEIRKHFGEYENSNSCKCVRRIASEIMEQYPSGSNHLSLRQTDQILQDLKDRISSLPTSSAAPVFLKQEAKRAAFSAISEMQRKYSENPHEAFDADFYKREYELADRARSQELNGEIFRSTYDAVREGRKIDRRTHQRMLDRTYYESNPPPVGDARRGTTEIEFLNLSTFDAAYRMIGEGCNPLVLDMANKKDVGGAPHRANAQEENCCRRSDLYFGLLKISRGEREYRRHISPGGVYVPHVQVFRHGPEKGYAFHEPFTCCVYASAAYNCNRRHGGGYDRPADEREYREGMKQKMRDMFRTAYREGHDSVLLGAFGCGAFENDPELVAQLYKEVLSETEFAGLFKRVAFGIIDIGGTHNLETFERSFRGFRCEAPPAFLDLPPVYDEAPREPKRCAQKVLDSCAIL